MRYGKRFAFALSLFIAVSAMASDRPSIGVSEFKNETAANWWSTEIAEYLECAMVDKDSCMSAYNAKEKNRRNKTKSSLRIE